MAGGTPP
ncbi:hypothetical protein EC990672_5790A, partial [Escherichia coli 99.0672]